MTDLLKLMALDKQDMQILSAYIQDSLTSLEQMKYHKLTNQFTLTLKRYVWEAEKKHFFNQLFPRKERRLAVLHFNRVKNIKSQNINDKDKDKVLSLLAMEVAEGEEAINLYFAEDVTVILDVESIEAQLSDQSGGWKSQSQPRHKGK